MKNWVEYGPTFFLIAVVLSLSVLTFIPEKSEFYVEEPNNILFDSETNTLDLSSLTLKQKLAQMVITYGKESNAEIYQNMLIGGVFIDARPSKSSFKRSIQKFKDKAVVPFFITLDLEGCLNPLENFYNHPALKDISTQMDAHVIGAETGYILKELGFNLNFAPVVDLEDKIMGCRSFIGTPEEIASKASSYISGLQEQGIMAVAKHYPGKTLDSYDSHQTVVQAVISADDLVPFREAMSKGVSAVMVSHLIVSGEVDSSAKPSVISGELIKRIKQEFSGLIITDEIGMLGLVSYYPPHPEVYTQLFTDLFSAGNDLILNFDRSPERINGMIEIVERAVREGKISEERIDNSVRKILTAKGIRVVG